MVLAVIVMVGELVMLEPKVLEPDKMMDSLVVSDALPMIEKGVTSVLSVTVASGVDDGVKVKESLSVDEGTELGVILALPPKEIVDGGVSDGDCVESEIGVIELVIVAEALAVGETVLEPVGESEPVSALEGVTERVDSALGVSLALAPIEIVDGGVEEGEGDCEGVGDEVEEDESLDDCVCVGVNVFEPVPDPDTVGVIELLDVIDALAPRVTLVDGVAVFEDVTEALAEAVALKTALVLKITLGLDTTLIVAVVINDDEIITLTLEYPLKEPPSFIIEVVDAATLTDATSLTAAPAVDDTVDVAIIEGEMDADEEIESAEEAVLDTLTIEDNDRIFDADVVTLTLAETVRVKRIDFVADEKIDDEPSAVAVILVVDDNTLDFVGEIVVDVDVEALAEQLGIAGSPCTLHIAQGGQIRGVEEPVGQYEPIGQIICVAENEPSGQ